MSQQPHTINNNSLAFMAMCNEFCHAMETARETERATFINTMLRLLPRIYISASDMRPDSSMLIDEPYIESALDEDYYDAVRRNVERLIGADDTYLEVFEEDMKYSDTPIAASVSEGLTDIFQVFYNFLATIKDAPDDIVVSGLVAIKDDFESYWSTILCNLLRAINHIKYHSIEIDDSEF